MSDHGPQPTPEELAQRLLAELSDVVADPHARRSVAEGVERALANGDRDGIVDALVADPRTRAWYDKVKPLPPDAERLYEALPGKAPSLTVYYVCPEAHHETVLATRPATAPHCPECGREMLTED